MSSIYLKRYSAYVHTYQEYPMTEPIVLCPDDAADSRVVFYQSSAECFLEEQGLTEDGWITLEHVTLRIEEAVKLIPLLTEFIANRPNQVHNNIRWCVREGVVLLNGVETYALPTSGVDMRVAGELVSKLLTTARSLNLFIGIPKLSDVEAELWIAARINDIAEACEF
jgi:hypothetical protein